MSYHPFGMLHRRVSDRFLFIAALLSLLLWVGVNIATLRYFPSVFMDEAENANHAWNLAMSGLSRFSLYDDLYPKSLYFLREAWPPTIRPFFIYPLAAWIKTFGFSLELVRLFSLMGGAISLTLTFLAGRRLAGIRAGLLAALVTGTSFLFLYSARTSRPEIWLSAASVAVFGLWLRGLDSRKGVWFFAAGFIAGLAPGLHTNGLCLIAPLLAGCILARAIPQRGWVLAGWAAGFACFLLAADWGRFLPGVKALFFSEFASPPLFKSLNPLVALAAEAERYIGSWIFWHWPGGTTLLWGHRIQSVLLLLVLALGCGVDPQRRAASPAIFGGVLVLAYAFLVGQKAANYLTAILPLFGLSLAWIAEKGIPRWPRMRWGCYGVALLWIVSSLAGVASAARMVPRFDQLSRALQHFIPKEARVAGPQVAWFSLPETSYRDLGALRWHRLMLFEKNVWRPLESWRPDYVILDGSSGDLLSRLRRLPGQPRMLAPSYLLPWPHQVIQTLDVGPAYDGPWVIVRIDWGANK